MDKHNLVFIDIETTGLNVFIHEIIEIGCVLVNSSLKIIDEFEIKVKPQNIQNADNISLKINHYKDKDWKDALTLTEAMKILSVDGNFSTRSQSRSAAGANGRRLA